MMTLLKSTAAITILIVDDTPDNLWLLTQILESEGYCVRKAPNGKMALQGVHRDPPDLILLDIRMPVMGGYEVCQQLKASTATVHIPILFISALDHMDDKAQAFAMGGQDYITKPFQDMDVLIRVKNQLLIQQQHQQLQQQNQCLEQEIAERLKAEAEVRQLALTDELTALYNRRGFFLLAGQQLKMAQRTQLPCCLLFADVDGLKQINDTFGHEVGDRVIVDAAQLLKQTFRDADIIARLGGDEFAILIPAGSDVVDVLCLRLQANIDQFNQAAARSYQLAMSVGIQVCALTDDASLEHLLAQADKLMYEHKCLKRLSLTPSVREDDRQSD
ncbi:MAG: diguanylate cyclase response regulator [Leptolyngbya foveolarum]|uniref:Diguanylate cyclase response regulator n=1 Tax=Leptolyngbya foveolarum TaxID=47253 RepID=A0A2W4V8K7_9CYAN|nr:MAG: diguanylate cyclase response regulator [Leptolyngbya foveolarum]